MHGAIEEQYIERTFELARKAGSLTYPNPLVGAVIVKNGKVIGEGYHKKFGQAHAEVNAIKQCRININGATLYTNLEPCCHFGKQPPCTEAIIKAGIKTVVFSHCDPCLKVKGKGKKELEKHGIKVIAGILKEEALKLNEIYFHYQKTRMPFVALKIASSLDGKIATSSDDSKWITNEKARAYGRRLRGEYQAILVGSNTILKDNPRLTARTKGLADPIRIILDTHNKIPRTAQVFRDKNYMLINKNIPLKSLLKKLSEQGIISLLVEGGAITISSFIDAKLAQKLYWFQAPILIGGTKSISAIQTRDVKTVAKSIKLTHSALKTFGDNILFTAYFK